MLVDAGATRFSGINNWEVFKRRIDGDAAVTKALAEIAGVATRVRDALFEGRYEEMPGLIGEEWDARKRLAPAVTTPEIDRIVEAARSVGAGAKVCGAGGGGIVAVWAPGGAGIREAAARALDAAGFPASPVGLDLRGLEVNEL